MKILRSIGGWLSGLGKPKNSTVDKSTLPAPNPHPAPEQQTTLSPHLDEDGDHVFPVESITGQDGRAIPGVTGEIRWSLRHGVRFRFTIPHEPRFDAAPSNFGMNEPPPTGLSEVSNDPSWAGTLQGGGSFELFGAFAGRITKSRPHSGEYQSRSMMRGQAAFASITMPIDCPLSFRHETPNRRREFIPSYTMVPWTHPEKFESADEQTIQQGIRGRLILQDNPKVSIYSGWAELATANGAWIVDESPEPPESDRISSDSAEDARTFLSFLVGRNLPFLWRDSFPGGVHLKRIYICSCKAAGAAVGNEQPLPLTHVREAFGQGNVIGPKLPELFNRFRKIRKDYNLEFVVSPIWAAFDGYADDKLAFACVSLERLATAHGDYQKKNVGKRPKTIFLTKEQSDPLLKALAETAKQVAVDLKFPAEPLRILLNKLKNVHQPPNADKLAMAFKDLGIELRPEEMKALDNRNRGLHGTATMDGNDLASVEADLKRFDILRTLVHKAVLGLLNYEGDYIDYGDRQPGAAYSIKPFVRNPPGEAADANPSGEDPDAADDQAASASGSA